MLVNYYLSPIEKLFSFIIISHIKKIRCIGDYILITHIVSISYSKKERKKRKENKIFMFLEFN